VELGRCGQHLELRLLPADARQGHKVGQKVDDFLGESRGTEVALSNTGEYLVHGLVGGEGAVENVEATLQTRGDVVTTTT
jgi:hypothetical protein